MLPWQLWEIAGNHQGKDQGNSASCILGLDSELRMLVLVGDNSEDSFRTQY